MINREIIVSCFLFAVALFAAAPAAAEDFIITVPVRLYNMVQGIGKAKVTCEILDSQGQRISMKSQWSTHGVNQYPSGLEEDIVLKMDAYPGKDPRTATEYKCDLKIQLAWVSEQPWQTPSQDSDSMYLKPKPGTEFRVEDSGPLDKTTYAPRFNKTPLKRLRK